MRRGSRYLFFRVIFTLVYSLWSCHVALADTRSELNHLTGLLMAAPENSDVAETLGAQGKVLLKQNGPSSPELKQAAKALSLHQIQTLLSQCLKKDGKERELANRILGAAKKSELQGDPCAILNSQSPIANLNKFSQQLDQHTLEELKTKSLEQSQRNIAKTYFFWERRIENQKLPITASDVCKNISCSEKEKSIFAEAQATLTQETPASEQRLDAKKLAEALTNKKSRPAERSTDELLLFTNALKDRNQIEAKDILNAQTEITSLMLKQFNEVKSLDFNELVKTNPAAIGQVLLQNPEWTPLVCRAISNIVKKDAAVEKWDKIYFWGGLVVGGTLLATGIGSAVGALVLSETALTGLVVAGAAFAVTDSVFSATKSYSTYQDADSLRASFLSRNGDTKTISESNEMVDEAFSHLISAGIGAASLIPFGSVWKIMSRSAQTARVGGTSQIAKITASENTAVLNNLESTLKQIKESPAAEKILIASRNRVSEEDYGSFIGQLSQLSPELRSQVLEKIKLHPEKASRAIEKGAQAGREACK